MLEELGAWVCFVLFCFSQVFDRVRLDYFMLSFWSNYVCKSTKSYIPLVTHSPGTQGNSVPELSRSALQPWQFPISLHIMAIHKMAFRAIDAPLDIVLDFCICWLQSARHPPAPPRVSVCTQPSGEGSSGNVTPAGLNCGMFRNTTGCRSEWYYCRSNKFIIKCFETVLQ